MVTSIVLETCMDHGVPSEEFFDGEVRNKTAVACRIDAIARMRAAGFNNAAIARSMRRHYDSVRYWTSPKIRARKMERMREYMSEGRYT
jgi:hypothetical protein